jgi:proline iminopeptidase
MKNSLYLLILFVTHIQLTAQTFPDSQKDGKYYRVNGAKIWTVSFGKGDPLFLIAGGPGNAHVGLRALDSLSINNTLVYYDAFGRGKSDTAKNVSEYSLKRDISDVDELRKIMGYNRINLFGISYGSLVAQEYAIQYPQNISNLILCSPLHSNAMWQESDDNYNKEIKVNYPEIWDTLMIIRKQGYKSCDPLCQSIYHRVPMGFMYAYNPGNLIKFQQLIYPNRFNSKLYYQMVGDDGDFKIGGDIAGFDVRKDLINLKMPILILAGRYDRVAVPWMMVQYKEYCPQAQFEMLEKSGHIPFIEEPTKTLDIIRRFLDK